MFLLLPLPVQILVHRIRAVDEILRLQLGELGREVFLERLRLGDGIGRIGGDRRRPGEGQRRQRERRRGEADRETYA